MKPRTNLKWVSGGLLVVILFLSFCVFAQDTEYDSALWSGALVLFENEDSLDYSVEYQLRLDDHMSSLSNDFVEFMGYKKYNENLLFNSGYRFTRRTDHNESRVRSQYIWEEARFMTPKKRTNILWLRYEMILGK